jgi:hypothetical protein
MNTTTTNMIDSNTTLTIVEALMSEADYSSDRRLLSDRIDAKIAMLETLGYTYYSGSCAAGVTDSSGHGIYGHTNGNTYTMVSPNREMIPVVYLVRENGLVTM